MRESGRALLPLAPLLILVFGSSLWCGCSALCSTQKPPPSPLPLPRGVSPVEEVQIRHALRVLVKRDDKLRLQDSAISGNKVLR
jgi:hypothetical protein